MRVHVCVRLRKREEDKGTREERGKRLGDIEIVEKRSAGIIADSYVTKFNADYKQNTRCTADKQAEQRTRRV